MNDKEEELNENKITSTEKESEKSKDEKESEKEKEKENLSLKRDRSNPRYQSVLFGLVNDYSNPKHIPFKDKLYLTPSEKYKIYGVFPLRMFLDILLVILTTTQVIMINGPTTAYSRAVERFLHDIFLLNDNAYDVEYPTKKYIYTIDDMIEHVKKSHDNYFELDDVSIGNLTLEKPDNDTVLRVDVAYVEVDSKSKKHFNQFNMTLNDFWIFNESNPPNKIKEELIKFNYFIINYKVRTLDPINFGDYYECYVWDIKQKFSFENRYHYSISLDTSYLPCADFTTNKNSFIEGNYWIHALVIIISLIDFVLTLRSIWINYKYYMNFKYRYSNRYITINRDEKAPKEKTKWEVLTKKDKNSLLSKFNFLQAFGCVVQLIGGILSLYEGQENMEFTKYTVGIGAVLAYLMLVKYLSFNWRFQTIFNTMAKSIPNLIMYFIGTMPIFISFVLFAVANFPYSERFHSFTVVILSLFGMMNGDSILDIINDLIGNSYFLGQIYVYSFNILFICVVINIFVSIIEEAFVNSKMKNQNHWIYSFVKNKQKKDDEEINMTGDGLKMYEKIRTKNIIRDVLNKDENKVNEENDENEKHDGNLFRTTSDNSYNYSVEDLSKKIIESTREIKKINSEINECNESKMKYELNQYLRKKIKQLEIMITKIKESV